MCWESKCWEEALPEAETNHGGMMMTLDFHWEEPDIICDAYLILHSQTMPLASIVHTSQMEKLRLRHVKFLTPSVNRWQMCEYKLVPFNSRSWLCSCWQTIFKFIAPEVEWVWSGTEAEGRAWVGPNVKCHRDWAGRPFLRGRWSMWASACVHAQAPAFSTWERNRNAF